MPVAPNLLLKIYMRNPVEIAYWEDNDNTGDPTIGSPYQWQVDLRVFPQLHYNHTSPTPDLYDGLDLGPGDWIATGFAGRALKIIEVVTADPSDPQFIVEDYERYNLFTDPFQQSNGFIDTGYGIAFQLGEDGLPIIGPVEEGLMVPTAVDDLMARFIGRNQNEKVLVKQDNHGMFEGDVIYADFETDIGYKKVTATTFDRAIGIVTETNIPGLKYFSYRPIGKLINNVNPPLWGSHGDMFYLDPNEPGALTNVKPTSNAVPIYLQLDLPTRAILLERGAESTADDSPDSETYKYDVTVTTGQTTFTMPDNAKSVLFMAINGIENQNFTFDEPSKALVFDPVETGYGVDVDDEVFFIYKN